MRPTVNEAIAIAAWRASGGVGPHPIQRRSPGKSPWRGEAFTTKARREAAAMREKVQLAKAMAR